jgi:hypothetical protein
MESQSRSGVAETGGRFAQCSVPPIPLRKPPGRKVLSEWNSDDFEESVEFLEFSWVACVEGKFGGKRAGRDEQIERAPAARLPPGRDGCVYPTVCAGDSPVHR